MTENRKRVRVMCSRCHSGIVRRHAYAEWDTGKQEWVLQKLMDHMICEGQCGGLATSIEEGDLSEEEFDYCAYCNVAHWPSEEDEFNSTWQQWQCLDCGQWNDRGEPPRNDGGCHDARQFASNT